MRATTLFGFGASLIVSSAAIADVGFRISSSQLVTWFEDDAAPPGQNWTAPERVFEGELALVGGLVTGDEPGFFGEDGTLSGFHLGFNVLAAARAWDSANQNFSTISPLPVTMSAPLVGSITTPPSDPPSPLAGPSILVPGGEFDFHYDYTLNGAAPGIYLLQLQITTDKPGIAPSLPYWVSLNYGLSPQQHGASIDWVRENLVPAPAALPLLSITAVAIRRRPRRR
jgi:hypothetical protein